MERSMSTDRVITLAEVRDVPAAPPADKPDHSWRPLNLIQLAANPPEPPAIGGLLYPGKRTVLSGETESMKTWFALILCKAELDAGFPVVWADLDAMGAGAMLERLELIGAQREQIEDSFHYIEPSEPLNPAKVGELQELVDGTGARLFVIDAFNPILNLHGLNPDSVTDVETFWRTIADPICQAGAATVMLDHVVKNPDNRGKYASGSERKASGAIVHLGFKLLEPLRKGGTGRSLLNVHKDRPGYLPRPALGRLFMDATAAHIAYRIEPDKSHDEPGRFRPTVLMQKVSVYLEQHPTAASTNEIKKSITGKDKAIETALQILVEDGYASQQQGPRRSVLYTFVRPYRESEEPPPFTSAPLRPDFRLNLESVHFGPIVPPYGGRGRCATSAQAEDDFSPHLADGDPIHEYEHPPPDDSIYDPTTDPEYIPSTNGHGDWNDL